MRFSILFTLVAIPLCSVAADCVPTPGRTIGTHYDISKATHQPGDLGKGLVMHGRVLSADGCRPLAGVKIIHWQAGEQGRYLDRLYAWRLTDENGAYRFETEWPALRPPHIHFQVEVSGHRPLATQWIAGGPVEEARFDLVLQAVAD
jgi:protocatechuate 3,4-dioxygenase beta subunit